MSEEQDEHFDHLEALRNLHQQRLRKLEQKAAQFGMNTAPEVSTEIDTIYKEIEVIDKKLGIRKSEPGSASEGLPLHTTYTKTPQDIKHIRQWSVTGTVLRATFVLSAIHEIAVKQDDPIPLIRSGRIRVYVDGAKIVQETLPPLPFTLYQNFDIDFDIEGVSFSFAYTRLPFVFTISVTSAGQKIL